MWPECGPKAARMRPEFKILRPEISPCKFPVARAQPGLKLQARNPTRTMKKVARPSPTWYGIKHRKKSAIRLASKIIADQSQKASNPNMALFF